MPTETYYLSRDDESFAYGPYTSRDVAVSHGPADHNIPEGATFWVGRAISAPSRATAGDFLEMLDQHAVDDGPDGNDGYEVSGEARKELAAFLETWTRKHAVRPTWLDIDDVTEHVASAPAPVETP